MVVAMAQASPSLTRLVDKFNTAHEILKKKNTVFTKN